jgi:hypothetical protein
MTPIHDPYKPHKTQKRDWRGRTDKALMKAESRQDSENTTRLTEAPHTIWVAPWRDERGVLHQNETLWADAPRDTSIG